MSKSTPISQGIVVFTIAIILAQASYGYPGVPDVFQSEAFIAFPGPGAATLMMVPDGSGPPFTGAHDSAGNIADATITLYVRDAFGIPIVNFPLEDLWIQSIGGISAFCIGGNTPDSDTDINGMTRWSLAPFGGGQSETVVRVLINGNPLTSNAGFPLWFNSPDINNDGVVNLSDVSYLSSDYYTGYSFRSDFNGDGLLNLSDIALFSRHFGAQCP